MSWTVLSHYPPPALEQKWREFLTRADLPSHYTSPEYFRETFHTDGKPFAVLALDGEEVIGVLSGLLKAGSVECGLQWRPQMAFDVSAGLEVVAERLLQGLMEEARGAKLIEINTWLPMESWRSHGFSVLEREAVVMLDLTLGADALFKQFAGTRRTDIRKAIKSNVEVFEAVTPEDFAAYYEIYCDWNRRKGLTTVPFEHLRQLLALRSNRRLLLARHEGRVIAGTVLRFYPGGLVEYAANCSHAESLSLKPNDLLQWRAIEWACDEGFRRYSFGSTHPFMRKFGGEILPSYRHRLDRTLFRRHEVREGLQSLIHGAFQTMPAPIKNRLRHLRERRGA